MFFLTIVSTIISAIVFMFVVYLSMLCANAVVDIILWMVKQRIVQIGIIAAIAMTVSPVIGPIVVPFIPFVFVAYLVILVIRQRQSA